MTTDSAPRLIILGGGIAALTTAFYASENGHEAKYPGGIHLYEKSPQLGGKGASVRATAGCIENRIEEHGLHVWFGSYDNAFRLLADCHAYLNESGKPRWSTALRNVEDGFRPCSRVAVMDHDGAAWSPWVATFPEYPGRPWHPRSEAEPDYSPSRIAAKALQLAESFLYSLAGAREVSGRPRTTWLDPALLPIPISLPDLASPADRVARLLMKPGANTGSFEVLSRALQVLSRVAREVRNRLDEPIRRHTGTRRIWCMVDILLAVGRGLIDHGVLHTNNLELIDRYDLREWLVLNGASEESVSCALLKSLVYDLGFAYEDGDPTKGRYSASVAVYGLFRLLLTYRGAVMWKMNAGMGEIVFAPIYEALLARGVQVHLGHQVDRIWLGGDNAVEKLEFSVRPVPDASELPVLHVMQDSLVGTLPYWSKQPSEPASLTTKSIYIKPDDKLIYGLPVGTIKPVLGSRIPKPWLDCADCVKTVGTVALQLWLTAPVEAYAPWAPRDITVGAYTEPFDTWADMRVLVGESPKSGHGPIASVAYFANVIPTSVSSEDTTVQKFIDEGLEGLWPNFKPAMILDQFSRTNSDDSSRYTLSVPGSLRYRLSPADESIKNMRPVGDWTRNSISAGCIEAAVVSGMLAANVFLGCGLRIVGESALLGDDR